jgi:hypothetical protein
MGYKGKEEPLPVENPCASCEVLEARVKELEALLMDALYQGAHVDREGHPECIDTCAISTWEDICAYFAERGRLKRINGRIYEAVPGNLSASMEAE